MSRRRYPLEAARQVRGNAVDVASRELADRQAAQAGAEARAAEARTRLEDHRRHTRELERQEAGHASPRSAEELLRTLRYLERRTGEAEALSAELSQAGAAAQEAGREVEQARARLARAQAEAETVERHREGWERARQRDVEAREEAEAEEVDLARRSGDL